jgi:quercetin dioxygenase-like cupin family protein
MSDERHEDRQHRRPHPRAMAAPFLDFDLGRELDQLQRELQPPNDQNAKTLVKYDDLRIVLIALKARARIPGHRAEGRVAVHTIRGHIRMRALERTFDLPAGSLLTLDEGVAHDVEALEDSAVLLTIAWPGRDSQPVGCSGTQLMRAGIAWPPGR